MFKVNPFNTASTNRFQNNKAAQNPDVRTKSCTDSETNEDSKKQFSVKKKVFIGATILAATVAAGILLKKSSAASKLTKPINAKPTNPASSAKSATQTNSTKSAKNVYSATEKASPKLPTKLDLNFLKETEKKLTWENADKAETAIKEHFLKVSEGIEKEIASMSPQAATPEVVEDLLARKTAIEAAAENISVMACPYSEKVYTEIKLGTGKITNISSFEKDFDECVKTFKKNGILSTYDLKAKPLDSEAIMKKYAEKAHSKKQDELEELLNPVRRLKRHAVFGGDNYLSERNPEFYRIISPQELKNLLNTAETKNYITSKGYHTAGNYSCITANPNYGEQAFGANGLPIRLKFKTKNQDGTFNMDLFNRIGGLKEERSIYRINGYNFDDIDWNNVCVQSGNEWVRLGADAILSLAKK